MTDETWHLVKNTSKVTGFIGGKSNKPTPIPAREIDKIMQQVQEGVEKPRPKVLYEVGEQVRITVRQEEDRKGKMLFSAAGGSLQLAQFSRPGNDNYRKVSGTVSGTIYEAVNERLIANAACVPCSASFVTQVQF